MINIFPQNSVHIHRAKNEFIASVKGTIEQQEDGLDGVHVFESIDGLATFLKEHYGKEEESKDG